MQRLLQTHKRQVPQNQHQQYLEALQKEPNTLGFVHSQHRNYLQDLTLICLEVALFFIILLPVMYQKHLDLIFLLPFLSEL